MKPLISIYFISVLMGCQADSSGNSTDSELKTDSCLQMHPDSVIPIIWGYPSEEDFALADSGLLFLGGCSMPENPPGHFCKVHQREF